jgi:hypothetical protein
MTPQYIAGFFDGEGCIGFCKCRGSVFPRILLTNTNRDILVRVKEKFGGDIQPLALRKKGWKQGYSWRLTWTKAVDFLEVIQPHLILKTRQAETVFAWDAIRLHRGRVAPARRIEHQPAIDLLVKRMTWLNKKGNGTLTDPIDSVCLRKAGKARKRKKR